LNTMQDGAYLRLPAGRMYGRMVMYDCAQRSYAVVLMDMERLRAGTIALDVDIRAVRAAPTRECSPVWVALSVLMPIAVAAAAAVSTVLALRALVSKRSEGCSTVRWPNAHCIRSSLVHA
jgi:hypothetical protein